MRQGCWATKRKCSVERMRFGSLMVSTLLSIFAASPLWVLWPSRVSGSLVRFSGLTRATAQCLRCATNWGAIPNLGAAQIRAARALLGIGQRELSRIAEIALSTVKRIELAED